MEQMRIWLDDLRPAPAGYVHCYSVEEAKQFIEACEMQGLPIVVIDCDYDLGSYEFRGGSGLRLLEWLAARGSFYSVEVHSTHSVGRPRMEAFVRANWPRGKQPL